MERHGTYSQYVRGEDGQLYLCPYEEFTGERSNRMLLNRICIPDEADIQLHHHEGR